MGREGRDYWEAQLSEYWDSGLTSETGLPGDNSGHGPDRRPVAVGVQPPGDRQADRAVRIHAAAQQRHRTEDRVVHGMNRRQDTALFHARKVARRQSQKFVRDFFEQCRALKKSERPSSPVAQAVSYALNIEEELKKFLKDSRLNIDNNPAERLN